jgi:3D (Asp-Asp-Asp) domain-containing protein
MYFTRGQQLKKMMRYFYSLCFLVIGMGSPVLAKNTGTDKPTPSESSRAGSKVIVSTSEHRSSAVAQAKEQSHKKSEITLTPDVSRSAVSSTLVSKQESSSSTPARTMRTEEHAASAPSPLVTRNTSTMTYAGNTAPLRTDLNPGQTVAGGRLARVTAYWAGEGDYYTGKCISATGVRLHGGHCAVDPSIIPYGSVVEIAGVGKYLAVDTGSAVVSRTAAREGGHTSAERNAIVVDLFFENRSEGEKFAAAASKYASISWWTPTSTGTQAQAARSLFAEEDWSKIQSKQL